ncbi:TPA: LPS export ABC transporter permease LptF [Escherichia coli]|nr:LPS export ABC transporter permease LptF [Escherichia coli]
MLNLFVGLDIYTGLLLLLALAFVLFYEAINGFHDTANAVATVIYTRAMQPQLAVVMAAFFNFFGVLLGGLSVAYAIVHMLPTDLLLNMGSTHGLAMVFSMLLAAIIWNLGTWFFGFLIFIFASYSAQRYLTEAANGTLALDVVLDIVFYKVLIALEMLLPVGLYVSVGVTLGQMYTDSEITAISAAGGSPGRLYKAVLYLAIPLSIFVTLLSMYGRPWAYAQIYQLEQQSQSELDVRQLRAKKFNTNDNGRMILSQTVDQDNNRLTDALIYTSTANRTRIFRARSVDVVDPSPEKPTVMLHNGTAYLLDHQGRDDNEQIYRNLQLHLNPLDQSPNVKRKAKSVTELARSAFPADHAELQWRQSRGLTALLMALLAISLSWVKPRQGRFSTLLPLTLLFIAIFYGGDVCRTLVANGAIPLIPGLWLVPGLMLMGLLMLVARDFSLLQKFSR